MRVRSCKHATHCISIKVILFLLERRRAERSQDRVNHSSCTGSALLGDLDPCPVFELSRYRSYVFSIENGKMGVYLENRMQFYAVESVIG